MRNRPSPHAVLRGHRSAVTALSFPEPDAGSNGRRGILFGGDAAGSVIIWDTYVEEALWTSSPDKHGGEVWGGKRTGSPVLSLVEDSAAETWYVQHKNGLIRTVSLAGNTSLSYSEPAHAVPGRGFQACETFCPLRLAAPRLLVCATGTDGAASDVSLRDMRTGEAGSFVVRLRDESDEHGLVFCAVPQPRQGVATDTEMFTIAAGYEDGSVLVWDTRQPSAPVSRCRIDTEPVFSCSWAPRGGGMLICGSAGPVLRAVHQGTVVHTVCVPAPGIASVRWEMNGKVVFTSGWDGRVRLFDGRRSGRLLRKLGSLRWHSGSCQALAWDPSSETLASGGNDRTIALWRGLFAVHDR